QADDLAGGIAALEEASALDPAVITIRTELARAYALVGRPEAIDRALGALPPDVPSPHWVYALERCRFALWFPDRPVVRFDATSTWEERVGVFVALRERRPIGDGGWALLERPLVTRFNPRFRVLMAELAAEARLFAGFVDQALAHVEAAVGDGMADLAWLDRCPVLAPIRHTARFAEVRARVAIRAGAIRDELDALGASLHPR
ncbi:MAG: hypothetical protein ABMB14_40085, partial [Myxococcota bacterium]